MIIIRNPQNSAGNYLSPSSTLETQSEAPPSAEGPAPLATPVPAAETPEFTT